MASINIHLAIAKIYIERNNVRDPDAFYRGTVEPDLTDKKDATHYGTLLTAPELSSWDCLKDRVNLSEFLAVNIIDNDYNRGYFLHLLTDYKFFREFLGEKFLTNVVKYEFMIDLYHTYDILNPYLIEKYNLESIEIVHDIKKNVKSAVNLNDNPLKSKYAPKCIIDTARIDEFIASVAASDLENISARVRKSLF